MIHRASAEFWHDYRALPRDIRARADKRLRQSKVTQTMVQGSRFSFGCRDKEAAANITLRLRLHQLQPFQFYTVTLDLSKLVLSLLHQPALLGAAENLGQSHGHLRRYPALPVYQFRKRVARHSQSGGTLRNS
jgi:hypothetical protein